MRDPATGPTHQDETGQPSQGRYPLVGDVLAPSLVGDLAAILAGACLIGALSQVVVPLPDQFAPITGMTLAVLLVGALGGAYRAMMSVVCWALAGFAGMPWFIHANSGFDLVKDIPDIVVIVIFVIVAGVVGRLAGRGWLATPSRIALLGVLGIALLDLLTVPLVMLAQAPLSQALYEAVVRQLPADLVRLALFVAVMSIASRFGPSREALPETSGVAAARGGGTGS